MRLWRRCGGCGLPGSWSLCRPAPESTCRELGALADQVVCATTPLPFFAVGESYWDFSQAIDQEVRDLLRAAPGSRPAAVSAPGPTEAAVIRIEAAMVAKAHRLTMCCSIWSATPILC